MLVPKRKFTQLFLIISTFTSFTKLAKVKVEFNANNYFLGFQGGYEDSYLICAQTQKEMKKLSSISKDGIGILAYLYLGALKGLENRKIKISKGSLHFFWVFLDAKECQKSDSSFLFEKKPLALLTNDEDIEYTLPSSSKSSMLLGEVMFSGATNKSFLKKISSENDALEVLDLGENSKMVLLRGYIMTLILENGRQTKNNDGTCSLFLEESINTKLRVTFSDDNSTILEMGLTNRVTGDVLDKAINFTPPEEFDEAYDFIKVWTSKKAFDELGVKEGKIHWSNIGDNGPTADEDDGDNGSGRRGKDKNGDGKGADGNPQEKSLFSKPIFWVIAVLSVGLVVSFFFIYKNATKKKYVVSRTSSPRAKKG